MNKPKEFLLAGAEVLGSILKPHGFTFVVRGDGPSCGGYYAWGEFVRTDRRLELHFRQSLGLVAYHVGEHFAGHEAYMRELGAWDRAHYPGFIGEPMQSFDNLCHDLRFATDFLSGDATLLGSAAVKQALSEKEATAQGMADAVGDTRAIAKMRDLFREGCNAEVLALHANLKYPGRVTQSQRLLVDLARHRVGQGKAAPGRESPSEAPPSTRHQ